MAAAAIPPAAARGALPWPWVRGRGAPSPGWAAGRGERSFNSVRAGAEGAGAREKSRGCSEKLPVPAAPGAGGATAAPRLHGGFRGVKRLAEICDGQVSLSRVTPLAAAWGRAGKRLRL